MDAYTEARKNKSWHHDIKKIDGKWVEQIVDEYQKADEGPEKDELFKKIVENYAIFRTNWANLYSHFMDGDVEAGKIMHDEVVWVAAKKFDMSKVKKSPGRAFNAYLVSGQLNTLKNMRNKRMSHKNHPRITCPICGEKVYQIDERHLRHEMTIERYAKAFPGYPVSSTDGLITPPWGGDPVAEITEPMLNRSKEYLAIINDGTSPRKGRYTMEDFAKEFPHLSPKRDCVCPMTRQKIRKLDASYPATLMAGYTEADFVRDFPDFEGIIVCPFSGKKKLEIDQYHLDEVLGQDYSNKRTTMAEFRARYSNFTTKPKQVSVINPYTGTKVMEITHEMLRRAGTTVKGHLEKYAKIVIGKRYDVPINCPFTGKRVHSIKPSHLNRIGKSVHEFYQAVCEFPLRKWQVMEATSGTWVDNAWGYLSKTKASYSSSMSMEEFERMYGRTTKAFVSTNSYTESDSGESMHVADLLLLKKDDTSALELEDSLMSVAEDELDKKIVASIKASHTLEDVFFSAARMTKVKFGEPFQHGMTKSIRDAIRDKIGNSDFDMSSPPQQGSCEVDIMIPSRDTIRKRLVRMIGSSDLVDK